MRNTIYLILLISIAQIVLYCPLIFGQENDNKEPRMYALLIGGGMNEDDNNKCFYSSIEYAYHTLRKLGYRDRDIKVLFYGGKTPDHPIVEGDATKDNFLTELRLLGDKIGSNDSLLLFRSGHGIILICF